MLPCYPRRINRIHKTYSSPWGPSFPLGPVSPISLTTRSHYNYAAKVKLANLTMGGYSKQRFKDQDEVHHWKAHNKIAIRHQY